MLSENFVSALLQASVTGAGLVLAVYTLILPMSRKLFEERSEMLLASIRELSGKAKKLKTKSLEQEIPYLKELVKRIEGFMKFPRYMSIGMFLTFLGYIISTFLSLSWLMDLHKPVVDFWLPIAFTGSTLAFLVVGFFSIKDTYSSLKKEFDAILARLAE